MADDKFEMLEEHQVQVQNMCLAQKKPWDATLVGKFRNIYIYSAIYSVNFRYFANSYFSSGLTIYLSIPFHTYKLLARLMVAK